MFACIYFYIFLQISIYFLFLYIFSVSFTCFLANISIGCYFIAFYTYLLFIHTLLHFSHQCFSTRTSIYFHICIILYFHILIIVYFDIFIHFLFFITFYIFHFSFFIICVCDSILLYM